MVNVWSTLRAMSVFTCKWEIKIIDQNKGPMVMTTSILKYFAKKLKTLRHWSVMGNCFTPCPQVVILCSYPFFSKRVINTTFIIALFLLFLQLSGTIYSLSFPSSIPKRKARTRMNIIASWPSILFLLKCDRRLLSFHKEEIRSALWAMLTMETCQVIYWMCYIRPHANFMIKIKENIFFPWNHLQLWSVRP